MDVIFRMDFLPLHILPNFVFLLFLAAVPRLRMPAVCKVVDIFGYVFAFQNNFSCVNKLHIIYVMYNYTSNEDFVLSDLKTVRSWQGLSNFKEKYAHCAMMIIFLNDFDSCVSQYLK